MVTRLLLFKFKFAVQIFQYFLQIEFCKEEDQLCCINLLGLSLIKASKENSDIVQCSSILSALKAVTWIPAVSLIGWIIIIILLHISFIYISNGITFPHYPTKKPLSPAYQRPQPTILTSHSLHWGIEPF